MKNKIKRWWWCCGTGTIINNIKIDRLSSLPDDLLIQILNLLPSTRYAVATSALSRRWRHLWTHLNSLRLDYWPSTDFLSILDRIIRHQIKSPRIHTFILDDLPCGNLTSEDIKLYSSYLQSWIIFVCALNPEFIQVSFPRTSFGQCCLYMPPCVLTTRSLVHVYLDHHLVRLTLPPHTPGIKSISLPNLRTLDMTLFDYDDVELMCSLFKSSPLLEQLELHSHLTQNKVSKIYISAPNLRSLAIYSYFPCNNSRFVIDAPKLERFKVHTQHNNLPFYDFITPPTTLLVANLELNSLYGYGYKGGKDQLMCLLGAISCVRSLSMSMSSLLKINSNVEFEELQVVPFLNLVHLELIKSKSSGTICAEVVPYFMVTSKLKRVVVRYLGGTNDEIKLIQFILRHANALEQLSVYFLNTHYFLQRQVRNKKRQRIDNEFCKTLFKLPTTSQSCQIYFSGFTTTAASTSSA